MLEFGKFNENNELLRVRPAHKLTKNYTNPPLDALRSKGWLPIYYDIPNYDRDTHTHAGYTFEVREDKAIAHAIIIETPDNILEIEEYQS